MLLTIARDLGEHISDTVVSDPAAVRHPTLTAALQKLHVRSCQITDEVLALVRSGHADGAHARWRTLHEVAVIGTFLSEGGENLAELYFAHETIERANALDEYAECAPLLGYEPLAQEEVDDAKEARQRLIDKYGKEFGRAYGWAAVYLDKSRIGLQGIERHVGVGHLRAHYRMASHNIHASPHGILFRLGLVKGSELNLAGASNIGFADPAHATAISLTQMTHAFASVAPQIFTTASLQVMVNLVDEIGEALMASAELVAKRHVRKQHE